MNKQDKLVGVFLSDPERLSYHDIEKILMTQYGFEKYEPRGSHIKFKHSRLKNHLIIPVHNGECKGFYKKLALKTVLSLPTN